MLINNKPVHFIGYPLVMTIVLEEANKTDYSDCTNLSIRIGLVDDRHSSDVYSLNVNPVDVAQGVYTAVLLDTSMLKAGKYEIQGDYQVGDYKIPTEIRKIDIQESLRSRQLKAAQGKVWN